MGTLLFIVLVILVLAVLLGAGGYSVRRYWSPAGSEVVETSDTTGGGAEWYGQCVQVGSWGWPHTGHTIGVRLRLPA